MCQEKIPALYTQPYSMMEEEEEEVEEATALAFIRDAQVTFCRVFGSCTLFSSKSVYSRPTKRFLGINAAASEATL
jgi:hypothetical protein